MAKSDFLEEPARQHAFIKSQRMTITMPNAVYEGLSKISFREGRSMSNLASYLLEQAILSKR